MDLEKVGHQTIDLAKEVGQFIREEQSKLEYEHIKFKGTNDIVTYVDNTAEKHLVERLDQIVPNAGFITEEETQNKSGEQYEWIVDPLDGTMNFVNGLPMISVSIALREKEETILGVIYEISLDECFYAWSGKARMNGEPIRVNPRDLELKQAVIATGFPYDHENVMTEYLQLFTRLLQSSQGVRRLGSAAVDLAYVACGRFESFYEYELNPWDVAAGAFIVQQAGGKVTDFSGGDDYMFGEEILAACPSVHPRLLEVVQDYMKRQKKVNR